MFRSHFTHDVHEQGVVVDGQVGLLINRGQFKLIGCDFIVSCFHRNPQFDAFSFKLSHEGHYPVGDTSKVVIVELLTLGRRMTQQGSPCQYDVGTCVRKSC